MGIFRGIIKKMSNRDYKNFAPNCFYHVYNRGVNKVDIFIDDQDKKFFLNRLKENLFPKLEINLDEDSDKSFTKNHTPYVRKNLPEGSFSLISYCIMPNHFHILIRQNGEIPVSKLISKVCTSYSKYFNLKYGRVGAVFQDQFKAIYVDDNEYLLWLSAYINLNPVVSGIVKFAENWKWGSYSEFLNESTDLLCDKEVIKDQFKSMKSYRESISDFLKVVQAKKLSEIETNYAEFETP
jgi:putative transposase